MRRISKLKKPSFKLNPMCAAVLLAFSVNASANPNGGVVVNGSASFNTNGNTLTVTNTPGTIINWQGFSINSSEITHFAQQSASSAVLNRVITNNPSVILGTLSSNGRVFLVNPSGIVFGAGSTVDVAGMVATSLNLSDADFLAGRGNFTLTPGAQAVSNAGNITAQSGGEIYLIAPNVENSGVITAPNGEILLAAGHEVQLVNTLDPNLRVNITAPAGDATNVGQLVASAGRLGLFGTIVKNTGSVSADSATMQGGKIVFRSSQRTEVGGSISASGVGGGEIKMLSDMQNGTVNVSGALAATSVGSGNGGFIDTSAAHVQVADTARVSTLATNGKHGTWLIDPTDYYIAVSDPLNGSSWMSGSALGTSLDAGNVIIQTLATGAGVGDIFVSDAVSWSAATSLTLQAHRNITVTSSITNSTAGSSIVMLANQSVAGFSYIDASTASLTADNITFTNSGGGIYLTNIIMSAGNLSSSASTVTAGTLSLNGAQTTSVSAVTMNAGTINDSFGLSASFLSWHGGTMTGAGLLTTSLSSTIDGAAILLDKSWSNSGSIDFNGAGVLQLDGNGVATVLFNNLAGGQVNFNGSSTAPITWATSATNKSFVNYGSLQKNIGSAATQDITFNTVTNAANGVVRVKSGTLSINGGTAASLIQQGAIIVDAGTTLFAGSFTNVATTGQLLGKGTFDMNGGVLTNDGAIMPAAWESGSLTIVGDLVMGATGTVILNLNGTGAGQYDVLNVTGAANVTAGKLELAGVGAAANTYSVLNATGGLTGPFTTISSSTFTQGTHIYGANSLTLDLTANAVTGYITWDGGAGTANWNDAANWSGDLVPTATDSLYVSLTGFNLPTNINVANYYQSGEGGPVQVFGDLTIHATNDITLAGGKFHSLNSNTFTLLADNNIIMGAGAQITTDMFATSNVILNSDADGSGFGSINLTGSLISSSGGNITLGGGLAGNGTGWARGSSATDVAGISLDGSTLNAWGNYGSGSIILNGRGYDSAVANSADGVRITNASSVTTSGLGSITVNGVGGAGVNNNNGVRIDGASTMTTFSGFIDIQGHGGLATGTANMGVYLSGLGTSVDSDSGVINIAGTGGSVGTAGGSNRGVRIDLGAQVNNFNGSSINITGVAAYGGDGLQIIGDGSNPTGIFSAFSSEINLYGLSGDAALGAHGVLISGAQTGASTDGNINISGTSIATGTGGQHRGVRIDGGAKIDASSLGGGNTGTINIVAQGGNRGDGFQLVTGSSLLTDIGNIYIVAHSGGNQSGSTDLIGAAISGSTIESKGGNILVSGTSNATFGGNDYGVLLQTSTINNQGAGNVTLIGRGGTNTDGGNLNNGIQLIDGGIYVQDGAINLLGTAGSITGGTNRGVDLHGTATQLWATGLGSINISGVLPGSSVTGFDSGVRVGAGASLATATGAINITGSGVNGGSNNYGVRVEDDGSAITSTSGNITLTGSGSTTGTANYGVGITNANALAMGSMVSSGSGNLKIVSNAGDVFLSGASIGTGVIASPIGGSTTISSQRNIIIDSVLSFNTSPVTLRVDNKGIDAGSLSFAGNGQITAGTVTLYYNPAVFGTQDAAPVQITATTLNQWMLVNNATNLQAMGSAGNLGGNYALGKNLDMTGVVGFAPIGSNATPFTGYFDGLNREISNLSITSNALQVGLFGEIGVSGVVKDLGLVGVSILGNATSPALVGGLAGVNRGTIYNTYVSGGTVISNNGVVGGLVGVNQGGDGTAAVGVTAGVVGSIASISNSYAEKVNVSVAGAVATAVGGLVGINQGGLGGAGSNGTTSQAGAIGGAGGTASITNSYVTGGTVSGMGTMLTQYLGGLVGQNLGGAGGAAGSAATAGVIGSGGAGGVGGSASITSSYSASGTVQGAVGQSGGLIGNNLTGAVGSSTGVGAGGAAGGVGGAAGVGEAVTVAWDSISTGKAAAVGAGNLDTVVNVSASPNLQASYSGFDFTNTWWIGESFTRPMLRSELSPVINNAHQLQLMNANLAAHYSLNRSIDLTSAMTVSAGSIWGSSGFDSIGSVGTPFIGLLDGQNFTITGLKVTGSNGALFDSLSVGAQVLDVGLLNVNLSGGSRMAALAVEANGATIINSYVSGGTVAATGLPAGGLVGSAQNSLIYESYVNNVTISSPSGSIGGLAGQNSGVIFGSYVSGGSVSGSSDVGGLVGWNTGLIVGGSVTGGLQVSGTSSTGGMVGASANGGLLVNASVNTVTVNALAGSSTGFGGFYGAGGSSIVQSKIQGLTLNAANSTGSVGSAVGDFFGSMVSSQVISSAVTVDALSNGIGPMVGQNSGTLLDSHYNIDAVSVNGAPQVQEGGLYSVQFTEWSTTGALNIANYNGAGQSLAQTGNIHFIDTALGNLQGMKDLVGFANDPRYSFTMGGSVNLSTLTNYSIPTLAGVFNGNDVAISNLNINTPWTTGVGFFGQIAPSAEVRNTYLSGGSVTGNWAVGALAAYNWGLMSNNGVSGVAVSAGSTVGGLVGVNDGFIIQSYVSGGTVSANKAAGSGNLGGLVGYNNGSIISNSYVSNGILSGAAGISFVGGLVGSNYGSVSDAHVSGLTMNNMLLAFSVGGLVGFNNAGASITNTFVDGVANVVGQNNVGGLVGENVRGFYRGAQSIGIVDNSYFSGTSVTGQSYVGGLVGRDGYMTGDGSYIGVTNNYVSSGAVTGATFHGPLVGNGLPNTFTNNRYNVDTMTVNANKVVLRGGLYSTQFTDWLNNGKTLDIANYSGAGGSLQLSNGKYTITNLQGMKDLIGFADSSANALNANYSFALGSDITLPVGVNNYSIPVFTGALDGQGHTISGVNIDMSTFDDVGFIQNMTSGASVSNLGLIAPVVIGNVNVGGLVGVSGWSVQTGLCSGSCAPTPSTIFNSYVSGGTVTGSTGSIGGLVSINQSGAVIDNSYSLNVSVLSTATSTPGIIPAPLVGGLVGSNGGEITNSFVSGGTVTASLTDGSGGVGGLVGWNNGLISAAYASGGTVDGAGVWDIGGFVGTNFGDISNSYAANNPTGLYSSIGGFAGTNDASGLITQSMWDSTAFTGFGINLDNGYLNTQLTAVADITSFASVSSALTGVADMGGTAGNTWRVYDGLAGPLLLSFLKPMTVSVSGSRIYDGTTDVGGLATYAPVRDAFVFGTLVADTSSQNVGTYSVTPIGGLFSNQFGYDISFTSGTVSITPAALTLLGLRANNGVKTYGTTYTFGGTDFTIASGSLQGADTIVDMTFTSAGAVDTANVGSYAITPSNAVFATQGSELNYNITYVNGTLTVNPAPLTVTADALLSKIYGDVDPALTYTSSGLLFTDTLSGGLGRAAGQNVGSYAINQGTLNNSNYAITFVGNTLSITPRDITVTSSTASKVYGDADPNLFTVGGSGLASWDTNATAFTGSLGHTGGENIGTYAITQGTLASSANYNVSAYNIAGSITITPAPLTVAANSQNKVLGTPDPLLTYMTYGLKLNDTAASILSGQLDRELGDTIGAYSINQGNLTLLSSNYTMSYVAGTFRILAPTVVQEITQTAVGSNPDDEEKEKQKANELLADATTDDSGLPLATQLPVCQ